MRINLGKVSLLSVVVAVLVAFVSCATETEYARFDPPPLLNGFVGDSEWDSATVIYSGWDEGDVLLKSDSLYIYLCVAPNDTVHSGLDLYIDNMDGAIFMLHISSAHGQRTLSDTIWQEWIWGQAELWTSNLTQSIYEDGRNVFIGPEAFEFQIDRQLLPNESFKFMLHLKRPGQWVPDGANTTSSDEWPMYDPAEFVID